MASLSFIDLLQIGTPIHEILHALGMVHEQSRPDRDDYVEIIFARIRADALGNFETETQSYTNNVRYDYGSVMHYSTDVSTYMYMLKLVNRFNEW